MRTLTICLSLLNSNLMGASLGKTIRTRRNVHKAAGANVSMSNLLAIEFSHGTRSDNNSSIRQGQIALRAQLATMIPCLSKAAGRPSPLVLDRPSSFTVQQIGLHQFSSAMAPHWQAFVDHWASRQKRKQHSSGRRAAGCVVNGQCARVRLQGVLRQRANQCLGQGRQFIGSRSQGRPTGAPNLQW